MRFIAIDCETANANLASICQIGVAEFIDGQLSSEWTVLIDPQEYFDHFNIEVHGITAHIVHGKPTFSQIIHELRQRLEGRISVCHGHFDRLALERACAKYGQIPLTTTWLDSARVARRAWKQFANRGYGLANISGEIGYHFKHHDALEDAKAAGHVLIAAIKETGLDLEQWLTRVTEPINSTGNAGGKISRTGSPDGNLQGEVVVFTGNLELTRLEAAELAAKAGCDVASTVTRKTTILVVGDQDVARLAGHSKSSKHRKAEQLMSMGTSIRILRETDFKAIIAKDLAN